MVRTKHKAGKRSEPAECVVSYCNFQDFPATYSEYIVQQNCPVGATLGAGGGAAPAAGATFSVVVNVHKFCQSNE